ncbi:hypothetical protein B0T26DRAFT_461504 [Lasiosphaeria miniovina]|uniref:Secreted protein n=1 Tax=Lasiosphaeria miniovina TaxID=1954250 RepID=A0AA39ZZR7_9PEZI|nr:uncharacterized protein B0T26DRAFT_461504 [Lasiosphaeria miniovina]KAK0706575.1 hypothetical protein B0T26DRAFT_461504 [Lasiosphaeria miniovina]
MAAFLLLFTYASFPMCMYAGMGMDRYGDRAGTRGGVFLSLFFYLAKRAAGQGGFYSLPSRFLFSYPGMCIMKASPLPFGMIFDGGCLAVCLVSCRMGGRISDREGRREKRKFLLGEIFLVPCPPPFKQGTAMNMRHTQTPFFGDLILAAAASSGRFVSPFHFI